MQNRRWLGNKLWYLLYLPAALRYEVFVDNLGYSKETIKSKRKLYLRKVRNGEIMPPRKPEAFPGTAEQITADIQETAIHAGRTAINAVIDEQAREALHKRLDEVIDQTNINPELVKGFRVSSWDMGYKDSDGEAQSHRLHGISLIAEAKDLEPKWPIPTRVESIRIGRKERAKKPEVPKTAIIADLQWPFVDHDALEVACAVLREEDPDRLIIGGDFLDLPAHSKYTQRPEWALMTQNALIEAHQFLVYLRKILPHAEITLQAGNHEERLPNTLLNNAVASYGLKRADALDSWPVMSVPYLLALDTLDIDFKGGFPANKIWLSKTAIMKHRAKGRSAQAVTGNERYTVVYGDDHRVQSAYKTWETEDGGETYGAFGTGCLCDLTGSVPGTNTGLDLEGRAVKNVENWQQGFLIGYFSDETHAVQQHRIDTFNGHRLIHNGKLIVPQGNQPWRLK